MEIEMLPTRKEIAINVAVGIKCFLLGVVMLTAAGGVLTLLCIGLYGIGTGIWHLYGAVGPILLVAPFILIGVLYGLYQLGKVGDRKDWFRDDLGKRVARDRRERHEQEKKERERVAAVRKRVSV